MQDRLAVSAAEFVRNFGFWQEKALQNPVAITHHGRERLVLCAVENFNQTDAPPGAAAPPPFTHEAEEMTHLTTSLAALMDNIIEGFILLDADMRILDVNRVSEAYFGRSRSQLVSRTVSELYPNAAHSFVMEHVRRVMRTHEAATLDLESIVFPGRHITLRMFPHPQGVAVLLVNRTEEQRVKNLLEESEAVRTAILRHPQIAMARIDSRGRFTFSDDSFAFWTGFPPEELLNCRVGDIVVAQDRRRISDAFEDVLRSGVPAAVECRVVVKDFSEQDLLFCLSPIVSEYMTSGVVIAATPVSTEAMKLVQGR
jgi:PAS domain S-box-containing protein